MSEIDVSIIIAIKNGAETLRQCLDSISEQNGCRVEIVVVDALSDDGTSAVIAEVRDSILRYVREPDDGIYDAWNKGVAVAAGKWCAFLGADDRLASPTTLADLLGVATVDPRCIFAYGDVKILERSRARLDSVPEESAGAWLERGRMLPHPGALHRTSVIREAGGFDATFRIAGDLEFLYRMQSRGSLRRLDATVAIMRAGGVSSRRSTQIRRHAERYRILRTTNNRTTAGIRTVKELMRFERTRADFRALFGA